MSGLDASERQQLYAALRDGMDGWSLVGAALGLDEVGADVEIGEARPEEIVAWAVGRVEHAVAAITEARVAAVRAQIADHLAMLEARAGAGRGEYLEGRRDAYDIAEQIAWGAMTPRERMDAIARDVRGTR